MRARECAELREDIVASWSEPRTPNERDGLNWRIQHDKRMDEDGHHAPSICAAEERVAREGDIYWLSPAMCQLLPEAAASLPVDSVLTMETPITPRGMCFFASDVRIIAFDGLVPDGRLVGTCAFAWHAHTRVDVSTTESHHEVSFSYYVTHPRIGIPTFIGGGQWEYGERLDESVGTGDIPINKASVIEDRRILLALHALLDSPGVTESEMVEADRPSRRRLARAGITNPAATRVIYLRGEREAANHRGSTEHHHRWAVRGHWRNQPCGPLNSLRKPTWIREHIKGPSDAPLLTGTIVRALTHSEVVAHG